MALDARQKSSQILQLQRCWCGESAHSVVWTGSYEFKSHVGRSSLLRCNVCGTVRTGPQDDVRAVFGDGPGGEFFNAAANPWELTNAGLIARRYVPGPLLEVGANTGMMLDELRKRGFTDLRGIEPNPDCAAEAQRKGHDVRVAWFLPDQAPEGPFANLVMSHVFEHIPEPLAALDLAARVLRPGGRLFLFVPNLASAEARADFGKWGPLNPVDHLWHFEPPSLRKLLGSHASFRVEEVFSVPFEGRNLRWNSLSHMTESLQMLYIDRVRKDTQQLVAVARRR